MWLFAWVATRLSSAGPLLFKPPLSTQAMEAGQCNARISYNKAKSHCVLAGMMSGQPLTIDPKLNFSTYLGGASYDAIYAIAADSAGNVYVAGETSSGSIPGGPLPARLSRDAWVARLNSSGSKLLYLVYLGGGANDSFRPGSGRGGARRRATPISLELPLPRISPSRVEHFPPPLPGCRKRSLPSSAPSVKLSIPLSWGEARTLDSGLPWMLRALFMSPGRPPRSPFRLRREPSQHSNAGGISDCFISKLNAAGSSLVYSTYLGGSGLDLCSGIAIDTSNDAYVTGTTYSTNIPTRSPLQGSLLGTASAFVAELNPIATALLYSTYLGGSILDNGNAIAVDSSGSAYVAGTTASSDFPTTAGAVE